MFQSRGGAGERPAALPDAPGSAIISASRPAGGLSCGSRRCGPCEGGSVDRCGRPCWLRPAALAVLAGSAARGRRTELLLATTTSVRDSGLLDAILPPFTAKTGIRVKVIAVGSGAALEMARKGDADLVISHAPDERSRSSSRRARSSRAAPSPRTTS